MENQVNAIYENGSFRITDDSKVSLPDGTRVKITVLSQEALAPVDVLQLAAKVYDGLTSADIVDVEKVAIDRSHFFSN